MITVKGKDVTNPKNIANAFNNFLQIQALVNIKPSLNVKRILKIFLLTPH